MMQFFLPSRFSFAIGIGNGTNPTNSFDSALFNSILNKFSLLKISSIVPPYCKKTENIDLSDGAIVCSAYSTISSKEKGYLSSSIGVLLPKNINEIGLIMEYSHKGKKEISEGMVNHKLKEAAIMRHIEIASIDIVSAETQIKEGKKQYYATFAAVALW